MPGPKKNAAGEIVFESQADFDAAVAAAVKKAGLNQTTKKGQTKSQVDFQQELKKIPGLNAKIGDSFKALGGVIDKIFGAGGTILDGMDEFNKFGKTKYDQIQKQFGGIRDIDKASTETARQSVQAIDDIYANFYNNAGDAQGMMIELNGETVNATSAFYKDASELGNNYLALRMKLQGRQSTMFNKMSREDQTKISMMEKGFQISNDKVAQLLERQISTTGEASTKIFTDMAAYADAVSKKTGISFQEISAGIANIMTDVQRFGNVQVDEAARIAASLDQLGLSYEGFGGMVDQFMNFDSAAQSLGNLTTVFGVHFDAMEMMQLANEDQEEFLYRMRDAFLDSGKAVEDMTLAEKRLAAQQMGMSIQDFENFMQEDRELMDLTGVTEGVDPSEGFEKMTENMVQVQLTGDEMKQYMINKVMDPMGKAAYKNAEAMEAFKKSMMVDPEKILPGYQEFQIATQTSVNATIGAGAFDDNFKNDLTFLHQAISQAPEQFGKLGDQAKLLQEIEALIAAKDVTLKDYLKVAASGSGSAEVFDKATALLRARVDEAEAVDTTLMSQQEYKMMLEKKQKIDMQEYQEAQRKEFMKGGREVAELEKPSAAQNQADINKSAQQLDNTALQGPDQQQPVPQPSPTPPSVNPELNQLEAELDAAEAQKQAARNAQKIDELAMAEVDVTEEDKKDRRFLGRAIDNLKEEIGGLKSSFKDLKIVNRLELDGKTVGKQLIAMDLGDGSRFAAINASGDIV